MLWIRNVWIHDGKHPGFFGSVLCDQGKIREVYSADQSPETAKEELEIVEGNLMHLLPGMIDIHLHGSYGHDFIRDPQQSVKAVSLGLTAEGTTSFLASLTVISHEEMLDLLEGYAKTRSPENGACFLGVHSEGPYLSQDYKALMDPDNLRDGSVEEVEEMIAAAGGKLKMMTIAPEREGALDVIDRFQDQLTFMLGHSAASCLQALDGLKAGAKGFTHLYNAMSQHGHRDPGCVSAALLDDNAYCELICDGFHVHPDVVRTTYKILGPRHLVLITDAMPGKGMPDGEYVFSKLDCVKKGNQVRVKETGRIAGSAVSMMDVIVNMHDFTGAGFDETARMAAANPAAVIGADQKGSLVAGKDADMILLDDDWNLQAVWIGGRRVYSVKNS